MPALHLLHFTNHWTMVEVFMLGVLIAVVRSAGLANLELGPGVWAYGALVVLVTANQLTGEHGLWERAGAEVPA